MRFAVAAGHPLTAETAAEVLRAGGTAVDAALAAALVAMVAEPVLAGLLGGGFLMVRTPEGRCELLDGFVQTPRRKRPAGEIDFRAIEADFGSVTQEFHIGAGAIATPGLAPALFAAHARHGRLPVSDLARPAVQAAREGVRVTAYQAELARIISPILTASPGTRALFCAGGDGPPGAGALHRNPELADVLEVMALEGERFVTEGEVAAGLLRLAEEGGHLGPADLRGYRTEWRAPLMHRRGSARVALNPPPSLGGLLIAFALELTGPGADGPAIAHALALTARARIEAALDRGTGDPLHLLSDDLLGRYRREVAGAQAAVRGTTQISVIDGAGMGAAFTLSNGEGCGLVVPGTGIMPNNMLGEDDLVPGDWLSWTPDRRLASMMAPMAVDWPDGRVAMLGSGGSNRIRTALMQVLVGLVDGNLPLDAAIEAPRLHVEGADPPVVDFESEGLAEGARAALLAAFPEAREWTARSMFFGGAHGAMRGPGGRLEAAGDPRRAGAAVTGASGG